MAFILVLGILTYDSPTKREILLQAATVLKEKNISASFPQLFNATVQEVEAVLPAGNCAQGSYTKSFKGFQGPFHTLAWQKSPCPSACIHMPATGMGQKGRHKN